MIVTEGKYNILDGPEMQEAWNVAKPFQVEDAEFAAKSGSVVLGHQTGLGKTFIAQLAWSQWSGANKALICGSLGSIGVWWKLMRKWSGYEPIFLQGSISAPVWQQAVEGKVGIYMCTYQSLAYYMKMVSKFKRPRFDVVVNDELHRALRHRNTIYTALHRLDYDHYIGMSATWASRGPQDAWPVMNLMNRQTFPSYWRWVNTWCNVDETPFGKEIWGVKNVDNLNKLLEGRYFRKRTWKEVGNQFRGTNDPPVIRRIERVPMSKTQHKLLNQLQLELCAELGDQLIVTPNSLSRLTRCLQIALSPRTLFPEAEFGGPVDWLMDRVEEEPHTVVFTPFKAVIEVLKEALLHYKYDPGKIFVLTGGTNPLQLNRIIDAWKSCRGIMLVTIDFAQSFDLDTTDTAYALGFDWDPNDNYQAEGRLRRLDSILQTPCLMRYILPEGSDYEDVLGVLDGKVMTTDQFLRAYQRKNPQKLLDKSYLLPIK